jgi:hypothetical protein
LHERANIGPFSHPAFLSAWRKHLAPAGSPVFLAVRADQDLAGVVPLGAAAGSLAQLGDPNVFDYTSIFAVPGEEARAAAGLFEWLREDMTPEVRLWGLPQVGLLTAGLLAEAGRAGWEVEASHEAVCPSLALPPTWDSAASSVASKPPVSSPTPRCPRQKTQQPSIDSSGRCTPAAQTRTSS